MQLIETNGSDDQEEKKYNYVPPLNIRYDKIHELKKDCKQSYNNQQYEICINICEILMAIGPMSDLSNEKRLQYIEQIHDKWLKCNYHLGILKWRQGNFAQSAAHWIKINQFDENKSASSHYYEGQWHWMNDDVNKAVLSLQKAVTLKPDIKKYQQVLNVFRSKQILT